VRIGARRITAVGVVLAVAAVGLAACTKYGASLNRPHEPVVLTGADLPDLAGAEPRRVVAFAWDGKVWHQVPVQVDERDLVNPGQIKNRPPDQWNTYPDGRPLEFLVHTPPRAPSPGYTWWDTFTPPDENAGLDADDQVVFLADDTGKEATGAAGDPAGVVASTRQAVRVSDPLEPEQLGFVYLYRSTTLTGGGAGTSGVAYDFSLDSGDYLTTFDTRRGPNPEHSTVDAPAYSLGYSDRWLNDRLGVKAGGAPNLDGLERYRVQLRPGECGRSEDTFNAGPGAHVTSISGPVRGVRSVIGANSGGNTVLTDYFYPQRQDTVAELRLHDGPGIMSFDDWRTGVTGLTYSDDTTPGVPIDGVPDAVDAALQRWWMVSSAQGSLVTTMELATDIPGIEGSTYYEDERPADPVPCTGDDTAWGQDGVQVTGPGGGPLPCTDPGRYPNGVNGNCPPIAGRDEAYFLTATRHRLFARPDFQAISAARFASHTERPLVATVS
jgi:hypothetical protein